MNTQMAQVEQATEKLAKVEIQTNGNDRVKYIKPPLPLLPLDLPIAPFTPKSEADAICIQGKKYYIKGE